MSSAGHPPTVEDTLAAVQRFNDAFNRHDVDAVMAAMTFDSSGMRDRAGTACTRTRQSRETSPRRGGTDGNPGYVLQHRPLFHGS